MASLQTASALALLIFISGCSTAVYNTNNSPNKDQKIDYTRRVYFLPKGVIKLAVEHKQGSPISITVTPRYVADTTTKLYLHREHSLWYDDKYVVEVGQDGLLTSINSITTFKGEDIITKIGNLAGAMAQVMLNDTQKTCDTYSFEIDIDPYTEDKETINKKLERYCISVEYTKMVSNPGNTTQIFDTGVIAYRNITGFPFTVQSDTGTFKKELIIGLPDATTTEQYKIDRGYFVSRDIKLSFTNGVLTKDDSTYPSEIVGFISLPLAAVNGVSQAITGRFADKTNELKGQTDYLNALSANNTAALKIQADYLKAI